MTFDEYTRTGISGNLPQSDLGKLIKTMRDRFHLYLIDGDDYSTVRSHTKFGLIRINSGDQELESYKFEMDVFNPKMPFIWIEASYSNFNNVMVVHMYDYSGCSHVLRKSGKHLMLTIWFNVQDGIWTWDSREMNDGGKDVVETIQNLSYTSELVENFMAVLNMPNKETPYDEKTND